MAYEKRCIKLLVNKMGESIFAPEATAIEVVDEAGGEFVEITQGEDKMRIEPSEWPTLKEAIDEMINSCR